MKISNKKLLVIDSFLSISLIIYFFYIFFATTSNIPINDDYQVLNNFTDIINSNSFLDKIKLFYEQHNEHRILYDKIWFFLDYKLSQQVNFNHLSFIGNLSLVGIFFFFIKKSENLKKDVLILIPLSVLIFNMTFHENITFAMASLSNFTVFLFSLLSIHFITKNELNNRDFALSILFLIFSVFTLGAGLFLILIIASILLYKKEKTYLYTFLFIASILIFIYFIDYQKPPDSPEILETIRNYKFRSFLFSFSFLGNIFARYLIFTNDINESLMLSTSIGFMFFALYLYLIKTKYFKKNLFIFSVMSLIILTAFITGITRSQLGIDMSIASRYRINSCIFLICVLYYCIESFPRDKFNISYLNGALLLLSISYFFGISYPQKEYLEFRKKQNYFGVLSYNDGNHKDLNGFYQDFYKDVLIKSSISQTYFLPNEEEVNKQVNYSNSVKKDISKYEYNSIKGNIDKIVNFKNSVYIEGWAFIDDLNTKNQELILAVEDTITKEKIFFKGQKIKRHDLNPYFKKAKLEDGGCVFRIKNEDLATNYTKMYLLVNNNGQNKIFNTEKKLR